MTRCRWWHWSRIALEHAVLEIGRHPRAVAASLGPLGGVPPVEGLHGGAATVGATGFCIAVVEAAPLVVALSVRHHVHGFRIVVFGKPLGGIVPVADAGRATAVVDVDAVGGVAIDGDLSQCRIGFVTAIGQPQETPSGIDEIVLVRGLVVITEIVHPPPEQKESCTELST